MSYQDPDKKSNHPFGDILPTVSQYHSVAQEPDKMSHTIFSETFNKLYSQYNSDALEPYIMSYYHPFGDILPTVCSLCHCAAQEPDEMSYHPFGDIYQQSSVLFISSQTR